MLAALCAGVSASALASQSNLYSPTTGTVSGVAATSNYNAALDSLASSNSGAAPPANNSSGGADRGQWWLNTSTSPATLEMYDGTNWLPIGALDATSHIWEPVIGGGAGTLASATTVNLGSVPYSSLTITGTTTINSFGVSAAVGSAKFLKFSAALTLTNSSSLILPGGANITTAAGDTAVAIQTASGVWTLVYQRATGQSVASSVPAGSVMAFHLSSCPSGWALANGSGGTADMRGVVARGYDPGNARDPVGSSQSVGSYEGDTVQDHTHSSIAGGGFLVGAGGALDVQVGIGVSSVPLTGLQGLTGNMSSGSPGAETRVKSTILLYCEKS